MRNSVHNSVSRREIHGMRAIVARDSGSRATGRRTMILSGALIAIKDEAHDAKKRHRLSLHRAAANYTCPLVPHHCTGQNQLSLIFFWMLFPKRDFLHTHDVVNVILSSVRSC